jgi:hypothetical protein
MLKGRLNAGCWALVFGFGVVASAKMTDEFSKRAEEAERHALLTIHRLTTHERWQMTVEVRRRR